MPRVKNVIALEGDPSKKEVLLTKINEEAKKFASEQGYEVEENYKVEATYDNMTMSKFIGLTLAL